MPTEQEAKPAVVTPSLQQWRSPSTFRGAPGEDPLKWLKKSGMSKNEELDSWEAFKNGLSGLFGDRQKYTRRAEEQLKCRAQRSGESTQSYIQSVLGLCQVKVNPLMKEDEKVSHLMKGVAEDIYQALLTREINDNKFYQMVQLYRRYEAEEIGRPRFERLPNVVPICIPDG
ncbi:retrotrans_gag domain-containing protein [Trichonephila clavipes]|nr:retrotrans_gag domain-containing protein [Trichonephila clavipes]